MDQERQSEALERAKEDYRVYRKSELLPDPIYLAQLACRVAYLEQSFAPPRLLDNPLPGHLAAAISSNPACRWLAIYDDFGLASWLENARSTRVLMDVDVITKSWYQQTFQSAYLEGLNQQPVVSPKVFVIIVARPETIAKLLISPQAHLAGLVSCCWMVDGDQTSPEAVRISYWRGIVAKLIKRLPSQVELPLRMNSEAINLVVAFRNEVQLALAQASSHSAGFLGQLPHLLTKLIVNLHVAQHERVLITTTQVPKAIAMVKSSLKQRHLLIQSWQKLLADREFVKRCEAVLAKIVALGPIATRELCRTFDDQRLERWAPVLSYLVRTEKIVKQADGRFDVPARWLSKLRVETC